MGAGQPVRQDVMFWWLLGILVGFIAGVIAVFAAFAVAGLHLVAA
jgi:hypothetical protein